jgi:hypothetical protein
MEGLPDETLLDDADDEDDEDKARLAVGALLKRPPVRRDAGRGSDGSTMMCCDEEVVDRESSRSATVAEADSCGGFEEKCECEFPAP